MSDLHSCYSLAVLMPWPPRSTVSASQTLGVPGLPSQVSPTQCARLLVKKPGEGCPPQLTEQVREAHACGGFAENTPVVPGIVQNIPGIPLKDSLRRKHFPSLSPLSKSTWSSC